MFNGSAIEDTTAGGRVVTFLTGSGHTVINDINPAEHLQFTLGSGPASLNLAVGAERIDMANLAAVDQVFIGAAHIVDAFTNAIGALQPNQAAIDAEGSLVSAAAMASRLLGLDGAHQAVLFSYQGSAYVFVDAYGSHVFETSGDAIVKLIGASAATDLSGVFHSL